MPIPLWRCGRPYGSKNKLKANIYLSKKEQDDIKLAIKLRWESKIITDRTLFEVLDRAEINGLIINKTFKIIHRDDIDLTSVRIFNSQLVNKIKGKNKIPYKKS